MSHLEAGAVTAEWARMLSSGPELVLAVADGAEGFRFARLARLRLHTIRDLRAWVVGAGLRSGVPFDARRFSRPSAGAAPGSGVGRIVTMVGGVP
jgi:hypothetical protein